MLMAHNDAVNDLAIAFLNKRVFPGSLAEKDSVPVAVSPLEDFGTGPRRLRCT